VTYGSIKKRQICDICSLSGLLKSSPKTLNGIPMLIFYVTDYIFRWSAIIFFIWEYNLSNMEVKLLFGCFVLATLCHLGDSCSCLPARIQKKYCKSDFGKFKVFFFHILNQFIFVKFWNGLFRLIESVYTFQNQSTLIFKNVNNISLTAKVINRILNLRYIIFNRNKVHHFHALYSSL
jgi:hypothetical protein